MRQFVKLNAVLGVVIGFHLCLSIAFPLFDLIRERGFLVAIAFGLLWSQPVLLAAWAALFSAPWPLRLPAAVGTGLLSYAAFAGASRLAEGLRPGGPDLLDGFSILQGFDIVLIAFCVLTGLLTLARVGFGWRIDGSCQKVDAGSMARRQFGLRQLMLWTAGVAIALGAARWLFLTMDFQSFEDFTSSFLPFLLLVIVRVLPGVPCLGIIVHSGRRIPWLLVGVATLVVSIVFQSAIMDYFISFSRTAISNKSIWEYLSFWSDYSLLELGMCLGVVVSLLVLKAGGWRFGCARAEEESTVFANQPHAGQDGRDERI